MLIFAAKIEKNAKNTRTFLIFRYNRGERSCYIQDKVLHPTTTSITPRGAKFTFSGIIGVRTIL